MSSSSLGKRLLTRCSGRLQSLGVTSSSSSAFFSSQSIVFDRMLKQRQRQFTLTQLSDGPYYDYLREEAARRLLDRLDDITKPFPKALELGAYRSAVYQQILQSQQDTISGENPHYKGSIGGITSLLQCDLVTMSSPSNTTSTTSPALLPYERIICDEEYLPFPDNSYDLVLSNMSMHWINDLPLALRNVMSVLKPDGAFIGTLLGGNTLKELRHCFYLAETERRGGMSAHTSPLALPSDVAGLMQAANFSLPTIDVDTIKITYPDAFSLMEHVYKMGEGHAALNRQFHVGKDTLLAMAAIYQNLYGVEEDGSVEATFELIYMIGWKPHESQPKACRRGSAAMSMKDLNTKPASSQV